MEYFSRIMAGACQSSDFKLEFNNDYAVLCTKIYFQIWNLFLFKVYRNFIVNRTENVLVLYSLVP